MQHAGNPDGTHRRIIDDHSRAALALLPFLRGQIGIERRHKRCAIDTFAGAQRGDARGNLTSHLILVSVTLCRLPHQIAHHIRVRFKGALTDLRMNELRQVGREFDLEPLCICHLVLQSPRS
jgi:hypothetical protein